MLNEFTWCEISSFNVKATTRFYEHVLGWNIMQYEKDYYMCAAESHPSASLIKMSDKMQKLEQPSFWLSFLQVDSLEETIRLAIDMGAKVEIPPTPFNNSGHYAILRDPAGAQFTIHEGEALRGKDNESTNGRMVWNELHTASLDKVILFYCSLFDWKFYQDKTEGHRYLIYKKNEDSKPIGAVMELEKNQKIKNYWVVHFGVENLAETLEKVVKNGGLSIIDLSDTGYEFALVQDSQGAAFCLHQRS